MIYVKSASGAYSLNVIPHLFMIYVQSASGAYSLNVIPHLFIIYVQSASGAYMVNVIRVQSDSGTNSVNTLLVND